MKWLKIGVGALVGIVGLVLGVGAVLPEEHTASSEIHLPQPPEAVWSTVRSIGEYDRWWPAAEAIERLPDHNGREAWRQIQPTGALPLFVSSEQPPNRLVTEIIDDGLPFGGTWTYDVVPAEGGSKVTITEDGRVYSAVFRFVSRFIMGHHGTMDGYLTALGAHFGEDVTPRHVELP